MSQCKYFELIFINRLQLPDAPRPICRAGVHIIGDKIYVAAGYGYGLNAVISREIQF